MFIYKTTNKITGHIYIGQHNGPEDDGYLGSGTKFKKALKEYGTMNFKREIIEHCTNQDDLNYREKHWILKFDAINPEIGYNVQFAKCDAVKQKRKFKNKEKKKDIPKWEPIAIKYSPFFWDPIFDVNVEDLKNRGTSKNKLVVYEDFNDLDDSFYQLFIKYNFNEFTLVLNENVKDYLAITSSYFWQSKDKKGWGSKPYHLIFSDDFKEATISPCFTDGGGLWNKNELFEYFKKKKLLWNDLSKEIKDKIEKAAKTGEWNVETLSFENGSKKTFYSIVELMAFYDQINTLDQFAEANKWRPINMRRSGFRREKGLNND